MEFNETMATEFRLRRRAFRKTRSIADEFKMLEARNTRARPPLDFDKINSAALANVPALLCRWLPGGTTKHGEFTALNPTRGDKRPGSFRINVLTGRWLDFATKDRGGDPISLAAYLSGLSQYEAAAQLAAQLGINTESHNK